jgi:hypothetical protein
VSPSPHLNTETDPFSETCFVVIQNSELWAKFRNLEVLKHRRVDNFKMGFREIGWGGIDLIGLVQDRGQWRALLNAVIHFRFQ